MDELEYGKVVIARLHELTFQDVLEWKVDERAISADPTPEIYVRAGYEAVGPYEAVWESIFIKYPVGKGMAMVGNPKSDKARLCKLLAAGETLEQMDEIFGHVLLAPRKKAFDEAIHKLMRK